MASLTSLENSPDAIGRLAFEAFVLGYPLVLADTVRRLHPIGRNQILHLPDAPRGVAPGLETEDASTVLTSAWIDIQDGPVVIHVPDVRGRHFNLTLVDPHGALVASFGSRSGQGTGGDFAIAGRRWRGELEPHLMGVRAPSNQVWAITRISANSLADRGATRMLAARQRLAGIDSAVVPKADTPMLTLDMPAKSCVQQVAEMTPDTFLHRLGVLLERIGGDSLDSTRSAAIACVAALQPRSEDGWSPEMRSAILKGFENALAAIRAAAGPAIDDQAGEWRTSRALAADPETPLSRAARVYGAFGSPAPADVLSLTCRTDESGRSLNGAERYRIHFPPEQAPPVEAFWSLTISPGARGQDRATVGNRNDLTFNRDGSLDLFLQSSRPDPAHDANWLPTPEGAFALTINLYWPRRAALSGGWRMPSVERLGSRMDAREDVDDHVEDGPRARPSRAARPHHGLLVAAGLMVAAATCALALQHGAPQTPPAESDQSV